MSWKDTLNQATHQAIRDNAVALRKKTESEMSEIKMECEAAASNGNFQVEHEWSLEADGRIISDIMNQLTDAGLHVKTLKDRKLAISWDD